jgi:hypothetical protein
VMTEYNVYYLKCETSRLGVDNDIFLVFGLTVVERNVNFELKI